MEAKKKRMMRGMLDDNSQLLEEATASAENGRSSLGSQGQSLSRKKLRRETRGR